MAQREVSPLKPPENVLHRRAHSRYDQPLPLAKEIEQAWRAIPGSLHGDCAAAPLRAQFLPRRAPPYFVANNQSDWCEPEPSPEPDQLCSSDRYPNMLRLSSSPVSSASAT